MANKQEEIISKIKERAVIAKNAREKEPREFRDKLMDDQSSSASSVAKSRGLIVSRTITKPIFVISISNFTLKP